MLDTDTLKITRRVEFPEGSRPWMLRISPNGREVWVQTVNGSNTVLDAQTLETFTPRSSVNSPSSPLGRRTADTISSPMPPIRGRLC